MDRERFLNLWGRCCNAASTAEPIYEKLAASYAEPHRRYHTGDHIDHCLRQLDLGRDEIKDADAIEMALWFHDVEYDPKASDNESRSAARFSLFARDVMSPELEQQIHRLILITIHSNPPASLDEKQIVDIDLSSFGLPWDEFFKDSQNVRAEFTHLSQEVFAERNCKFLQSLLDRPTIFSTEFYRNRYESISRENIRKQIEALKSSVR